MEDGDRNTKFLYRVENNRRKFTAIENIVVEGELHVDDSSVKGEIVLYLENFPFGPFLQGISYNSVPLEDAWELEKSFLRRKFGRPSTTKARKKR